MDLNIHAFKHIYKIKLRFSDFDIMGHVNNTRHMVFVEDARIDYLEKISGLSLNDAALSAIIARVEMDYLVPVFPGAEIQILTRCKTIGTKSFTLEHLTQFYPKNKPENAQIATKSKSVIVSYDYKKAIAVPNSPVLIKAINKWENSKNLTFTGTN